MKKLKFCPICNSKNIYFLYKNEDKNLGVKGEFNLNKCHNCKSLFMNPMPSKKEASKYYPKDKYYSLQKIDKGRKAKLKIKLEEIYFGNGSFFEKIFFSPISFLARGTKVKKGIKLLDIGSGSGQFIYGMKRLGLEVFGLEPGKFNRDESKKEGIKIEIVPLEKTRYKKEYFDVITLNHVLEHVDNPHLFLKKVKSLLKKDGLFILAVPNSRSFAHWMFNKNWYQLDTPRHLINYSNKNLIWILKKSGFEVVKIRYNSRPSQFSVSLQYLLGFKNKNFEKILNVLFLPLTWAVNALKIGDQIEVWCKK